VLRKKPYDDLVPGKCKSRLDTQYLQESNIESQFTLSATTLLMLDLCKTQQIETFMIDLCFINALQRNSKRIHQNKTSKTIMQ